MLSLTPDLLNRLRETLRKCPCFDSDETLQALFDNDPRIEPWAGEVQNASRASNRVDFVIALLRDREHADYHENALVLFLHALCDTIDPRDTLHHDLDALARDLAFPSTTQPTTPNPQPVTLNLQPFPTPSLATPPPMGPPTPNASTMPCTPWTFRPGSTGATCHRVPIGTQPPRLPCAAARACSWC